MVTYSDVTERREMEEALRGSQERVRQVTESIQEVFWLTDLTKEEMVYVSPAYERIWGRTPEALYREPRSWMDYIHPEDRERVRARLPEQVEGTYNVEYRIVQPDGTIRWICDRAFPVRDADGAVQRITGIAGDITERKELEHERERTLSLLQATLEATADGILAVDRDGHTQAYNERFLEMWRIPDEVIRAKDDEALLAHVASQLQEPQSFLTQAQSILSQPESSHFDVLTFRDGRIFERYTRPRSVAAEIVGRVFSFRDVTQRQRAHEALQESERRLTTLIRSLPGVVYRSRNDPDWTMEYIGGRIEDLIGYAPEALTGEGAVSVAKLIHPDDRDEVWQSVQEALEVREPFRLEYRLRTAGGEEKWVWEQGEGVFSSEGELKVLEGGKIPERIHGLSDGVDDRSDILGSCQSGRYTRIGTSTGA